MLQLEFNVFDMIGRSLPYVFVLPPSWVGPLSLTRVIFYPLVFLCVWNPPVVPDAELWMYAINVIFALTNGFLGSMFLLSRVGTTNPDLGLIILFPSFIHDVCPWKSNEGRTANRWDYDGMVASRSFSCLCVFSFLRRL